jgi:hypothetical protein
LRDLSPELGSSGNLKVRRDEAARLLNDAVNHNGRGTCATVRGGLPFPPSECANTGENHKTRKLAFNWKQFPFRAKYSSEIMENPQPQKLPPARQQRIHQPEP